MKRGWLASLLAAAVVLPMAARGAGDIKTADTTPVVKTPTTPGDTTTTKTTKGRLPAFYAKLPVDATQKEKIYEIQATFAPKIKALHEQLEALEAEQTVQIKAVLTPEQVEKLKVLMADSKKHHSKTPTETTPKPAPTDKPLEPSSATPAPAPNPAPAAK